MLIGLALYLGAVRIGLLGCVLGGLLICVLCTFCVSNCSSYPEPIQALPPIFAFPQDLAHLSLINPPQTPHFSSRRRHRNSIMDGRQLKWFNLRPPSQRRYRPKPIKICGNIHWFRHILLRHWFSFFTIRLKLIKIDPTVTVFNGRSLLLSIDSFG